MSRRITAAVAALVMAVIGSVAVVAYARAADQRAPAGDHLQDNHQYTRATRLLLPSVEVLAVGDSTTVTKPDQSRDKPSGLAAAVTEPTTTLLTLAVTQDQAQRLIHGSRTGTLAFA